MIAALPMYFAPEGAAQALWDLLKQKLTATLDMALPQRLTWPVDYEAHWLDRELFLSQTCGYPLTHNLRNKVQLVGTPIYNVPGADGFCCCSQVIKRRSEERSELEDFRDARVAYNATDSQSGYNALRATVTPLATKGHFFGSALKTGNHLASIEAVLTGLADLAAIDPVTWTLATRAKPQLGESLEVFTKTLSYPGLPLITSTNTSEQTVSALRTTLRSLCDPGQHASILAPLCIKGFAVTTDAQYQVCLDMETTAWESGVRSL